ncbi:MAG: hypothetical protein WA152_02050 [Microgenomates group bacterium]
MAEGRPGVDGKSINTDVASFTPRDGVISVGAKDAVTGAPVQAEALSSGDSDRFRKLSETKEVKSKSNPENPNATKKNGEYKQTNNKPETKHTQKEAPMKSEYSSDNNSKVDEKKEKGVKSEEDFGSMDFSELNSLRRNFTIEGTRRQNAEDEFNRRVKNFTNLREGEIVGEIRHTYLNLVRNTNWDGLFGAITTAATELESSFARSVEGQKHPELRGVITEVLRVERAQLLLEGMRRRGIRDTNTQWLTTHGYTPTEISRFRELSLPINAVLDLERTPINTLANMVGQDLVVNVPQPSSLSAAEMENAVQRGTEKAINAPSIEAERQAFRTAEYQMVSVPPVDSRTKFLLTAENREILIWDARAKLSRACAIKMSGGMNEIANNPEAKTFTNEQEQLLLSVPGVLEAISLEAYLIVNGAEMNAALKNNGPELPETIFDITEEGALSRMRQAKVDWLMTYRNLNEDQAKDAEAISRNFVYLNDLVEDFDSKADKNDKRTKEDHKYIPNSMPKLKSVAVHQTMHLQERLEAKNKGDSNWSALGAYANSHPKQIEGLLPLNLFKSALEIGRDQNSIDHTRKIGPPDNEGVSLLEVFVGNGVKLAVDPRNINLVMPAISHPNAREGRLSGYCAVTLSAAATVLGSLSKPNEIVNSKNWAPLGDAFRDLDVDPKYRQNIAIAIVGVNTSPFALGFGPAIGWGKWWEYRRKEIERSDPNFFSWSWGKAFRKIFGK